MRHPLLVGGVLLGSILGAYAILKKSPGDRAEVGFQVMVDANRMSFAVPADLKAFGVTDLAKVLTPQAYPPGTLAYIAVTGISADGTITGQLQRIRYANPPPWSPSRDVGISRIRVTTTRKDVLPFQLLPPPPPGTTP